MSNELNVKIFNYEVQETALKGTDPATLPHVKAIFAPYVWEDSQGENTVISILDTGIDSNHTFLKSRIVGTRNFVNHTSDCTDVDGHGTHVAGIVASVAPKAKLLICKVLGDNGEGSYASIVEAIQWCQSWRSADGLRVNAINMSLGSPQYDATLASAIRTIVACGIAVVAAAGNEGDNNKTTNEVSYPAYFPDCISVGACDVDGGFLDFTNTNKEVDVAAPGYNIISTMKGNTWAKLSGTSMAAPVITGALALVASKFKLRTGAFPTESFLWHQVRYLTRKHNALGLDPALGAGMFSFLPLSIRELERRAAAVPTTVPKPVAEPTVSQ